ncbi:hypothetical protein E1176_18640 [Fulvivirga sp. RKSG066]|uniref:hypothetical protein n=1 Tax=Fulvivirga aurantia TaxID=2529383 RepID=UPI0012BBF7D6|nr:hypothetical protein [Fulvivirga aurantia]MTI23055.1 hypothetical protein [Fulvivirga aurantia]
MNKFGVLIDTNFGVAIGIAVILLLLLLIKEFARSNKKNLWLRLLCSLLGVIALFAIWIKPVIQLESELPSALLLTQGYEEQQIDELKDQYKFDEMAQYDSLSYTEKEALFAQNRVIMVGDGIPEYDLPLYQEHDITYLLDSSKTGILRFNYSQEAEVGELLEVNGLLQADYNGWLKLRAFDQVVDSIQVTMGQQAFKLQVQIKSAGKYVFQVQEVNEKSEVLRQHDFPIIVSDQQSYKILMVNEFPTFELKYLKNYLAAEGHELQVRNQLTRGRYKFEAYNTSVSRFYKLSSNVLEAAALLVIDYPSLKSLSRNELSMLKERVRNGLGVYIMPSEELFTANNDLIIVDFEPTTSEVASVNMLDKPYRIDTYGYVFKDQPGFQFTFNNLTGAMLLGEGQVGGSVLQNTYKLWLAGEQTAYKNLWKKQLEALLPSKRATSINYNWPVCIDQPVDFEFGAQSKPMVNIDGVSVAPIQDMHISDIWSGTYWPKSTGWHTVMIENDTTWLFVNQDSEWEGVVSYNRSKANSRVFNHDTEIRFKVDVSVKKEIDPLWFYLLFLICVGYLWLEPKLS